MLNQGMGGKGVPNAVDFGQAETGEIVRKGGVFTPDSSGFETAFR